MTLLLKQLFAFIKLLNSEKGTNQIATGMVCGMIMGFSPAFSLQTALVFVILFFFRIQIGAAFVTAFFFKFVAFLLDPAFHAVGVQVLELESLKPTFTTLYNMPIVPFTRFYNSVVMGAGIIALALAIPMFFVFKMLIAAYRLKVVSKFENTRAWKAVKATSFYQWYVKYEQLRG